MFGYRYSDGLRGLSLKKFLNNYFLDSGGTTGGHGGHFPQKYVLAPQFSLPRLNFKCDEIRPNLTILAQKGKFLRTAFVFFVKIRSNFTI